VNAQTYSWYGDEELHALLERYISRAGDAAAAGRKLKLWLGSGGGSAVTGPAPARPPAPRGESSPRPQRATEPVPAKVSADGHVWLTRKEAAEYLGRSVKTLGNWAKEPDKPPFRRKGGVRYRLDLLEAWQMQNYH
jgi:hypothetical protein